MLIVHLVPVGLSLLDHVELPDPPVAARDALRHAAPGPRHELDWDRLGPAGMPQLATTDPLMAAEWTSIRSSLTGPRYASVDGEAYVFLATDTDQGLRAATLLTQPYQRSTVPYSTVRYLDEPLAAGRPMLEPGDVSVCRIPDLDLGTLTPTSTTWRSLGVVGRMVADTATQTARGEWHVIVHLSGGYKAMIPYLMVLAEAVHSRLRDAAPNAADRPSIRAVLTHESDPDRVIDVPVRAVEGDLLADVKKVANAARPSGDGGYVVNAGVGEDLLGLFIEEETERTRWLTEAALIMVNAL
ncbi:MAG: hypothetical protein ABR608_16220 [Pseudonocardiaceae bacterium]